jgi:all-trans-8'-apo-beta-carotenal 15,15'-oxygenase
MQRRSILLQACAGLAAATTGSVHAAPARADSFDTAVKNQPLLKPFKGVSDASGDRDGQALLRGRWPDELRGRFYRNGPALFERGGERYHHWFDGDGMVQQFRIDGGRITHRGRLVRTTKLKAEQQAGRFLMPTLGTHIENTPPLTGPDSVNAANTNALEHGGRLLALWEGGSAYGMDPADLSTQGPVTWGKGLQQLPFSAHPKVDAAGHLWNIGTQGDKLIAWHVDPQGQLVSAQVGELPFRGGMVHDMAVTERYLVVPLPPVRLHFNQPVGDGPRRFALEPGEPLRVLVMDKADIQRRRIFELPAEMVFHVGNAHDTADGGVQLSWVGAPDAWFLDQGAVSLMAGKPTTAGAVTLRVGRFDMATGRVQLHSHEGEVEFPRVHPQRIGLPARHLVMGAAWPVHPSRRGLPLLHGVQMLDTETGRMRRFDYGEHAIAEEHVIVPKPGKSGELDAWLLGTTFDARRQATVLNLLDAAHVEDGPIAEAVLPYALPLGFHGNFHAA